MNVEITRLASGLTVVTQNMPHLESVALGVWIKSGSRNETTEEHGIAHLLEHMAFKGTARRSARDIAEEIENVGGELNAATSTETTSYYARVLKDHVPLAIDILADILTESAFDEDELQREKHVILQEIGAANDTPDDVVFDRFSEVAYRGQTIGGRSSARRRRCSRSRRTRSADICRATTRRTGCSSWPPARWTTTRSSSRSRNASPCCR